MLVTWLPIYPKAQRLKASNRSKPDSSGFRNRDTSGTNVAQMKHNPGSIRNEAFPVLKLYYNQPQSSQHPNQGTAMPHPARFYFLFFKLASNKTVLFVCGLAARRGVMRKNYFRLRAGSPQRRDAPEKFICLRAGSPQRCDVSEKFFSSAGAEAARRGVMCRKKFFSSAG